MFKEALGSVKDVHEQLKEISLQGDGFPVSIDDLQDVISQMFEVDIEKVNVVTEFRSFVAAMYKYDNNKAIIYISAWHDERTQRFGAANEFAHIIMDADGHRSADGAALIEALTTKRTSLEGEAPREMGPAEISETLAPIIATELLYPFPKRQEDLELLKSGEKTERELADYYDLPEFVIGDALNETLMEIIEPYWREATGT